MNLNFWYSVKTLSTYSQQITLLGTVVAVALIGLSLYFINGRIDKLKSPRTISSKEFATIQNTLKILPKGTVNITIASGDRLEIKDYADQIFNIFQGIGWSGGIGSTSEKWNGLSLIVKDLNRKNGAEQVIIDAFNQAGVKLTIRENSNKQDDGIEFILGDMFEIQN